MEPLATDHDNLRTFGYSMCALGKPCVVAAALEVVERFPIVPKKSGGMAGWGELNVALNQLVRSGIIVGYKTAKPERDGPAGVEAQIAPGADQAEVVRAVREALPATFADATIRTREA